MANTETPKEYGLTELPPEPKPFPGCKVCLGFSVRRENARSRGDYSAVSDANVVLRRHWAEAHVS
ncbi:hypothetical protein [Streptomyces sp. NPDC059575]|uniref:hypothetical protein n=1 Tax=Streptomyces sp. NPDC059575 TaxID=3346872 RepID=UPI00368A75CF